MRYYPIYIDTENEYLLIVGGGKVSYRKAKDLLKSKFNIIVVSKEFNKDFNELKKEKITLYKKNIDEFIKKDLSKFNFKYSIIATDDKNKNDEIKRYFNDLNILCLRADNKDDSDYIMASVIEDDNFNISISTDGKSPTISKYVKNNLEEFIKSFDKEKFDMIKEIRSLLVEVPSDEREEDVGVVLQELIYEKKESIKKYLDTLKRGKMKIIVGTRGSNLALTQTKWVIEKLKEKNKNVEFEIKIIKTKGDIKKDVPLDKINDKGVFVKELENELLNKTIDIGIHSMKDLPSVLPKGLILADSPKREDPRDVLVLKDYLLSELNEKDNYEEKLKVLENKVIGTGSKRRKYQLFKKNIETKEIRGNIETRIDKINSENLDGVMLAAAGMIRAGYEDKVSMYLDPKDFIPSPTQGILGIEIRKEDKAIKQIVESISDVNTNISKETEREFLREVGASCHSPVACYAKVEYSSVYLYASFGTDDGKIIVREEGSCMVGRHLKLAKDIAKKIKERINEKR